MTYNPFQQKSTFYRSIWSSGEVARYKTQKTIYDKLIDQRDAAKKSGQTDLWKKLSKQVDTMKVKENDYQQSLNQKMQIQMQKDYMNQLKKAQQTQAKATAKQQQMLGKEISIINQQQRVQTSLLQQVQAQQQAATQLETNRANRDQQQAMQAAAQQNLFNLSTAQVNNLRQNFNVRRQSLIPIRPGPFAL